MIQRISRLFLAVSSFGAGLSSIASPVAGDRSISVTQDGVTWTFDQPRQTGRFVMGDWWVVGPVTVVSV